VTEKRLLNVSLLALAGAAAFAAFSVYRTPAMAFLLEGFRLCG
jgi:hypothetical protein